MANHGISNEEIRELEERIARTKTQIDKERAKFGLDELDEDDDDDEELESFGTRNPSVGASVRAQRKNLQSPGQSKSGHPRRCLGRLSW